MTSLTPCWCLKSILKELNSFVMHKIPFVTLNKYGRLSWECIRSILLWNFPFIWNACLSALKLALAEYASSEFNSKYEKLAVGTFSGPRRIWSFHVSLLFCRARQRNVQRFITHVHSHCFVNYTFLFGVVLVAAVFCVRSLQVMRGDDVFKLHRQIWIFVDINDQICFVSLSLIRLALIFRERSFSQRKGIFLSLQKKTTQRAEWPFHILDMQIIVKQFTRM